METKTFEKEKTTITVHSFHEDEQCFPFSIVEKEVNNEETTTKEIKIALGNSIVEEQQFNSVQEAEDYIKSKPYTLILALIASTIDLHSKYCKEQEELLNSQNHETK